MSYIVENVEIGNAYDEKVVRIEINHPRNNVIDTVEIDISCVRAIDEIRIKYDFERDGWVIYQPRDYYVKVDENRYEHLEEWIESAFCPAWKFELEEEEKFNYKPSR